MDINKKLSPHFRLCEFLHNGSTEGVTVAILENLRVLSRKLEQIREIFGKPVIVTSGYRTPEHNAKVGGVSNSQHLLGKAADIVVSGLTPTQMYEIVKDHWQGGLGYYPDKPNRKGWLHLDTGSKRFWIG